MDIQLTSDEELESIAASTQSATRTGLTTDIQLGLKLVTLHLGPLTKYGKYPRTSQASAKSNTTKVVLCNMTFLSYRVLYTLKPGTCDV